MKTKSKLIFASIVVLLTGMLSLVGFSATSSATAQAEEVQAVSMFDNVLGQTVATVSLIEQELASIDTDVASELLTQIDNLNGLLTTASSLEERQKIASLIATTERLLGEYTDFSTRPKLSGTDYINATPPSDIIVAVNLTATAIIAYFNSQNCPLSAELVAHCMDVATAVDSDYIPVYGGNVAWSNIFLSLASDQTKICGSDEFPEVDSTASANDKDMNWGIGHFNYTKCYRDNGTITFAILDRYDFDPDNETYKKLSPKGLGAQVMYVGQDYGIVRPFYTNIFRSVGGPAFAPKNLSLPASHIYQEELAVMNSNSYMEFNLTFAIAGNKVIQTFGPKDAFLYLYNSAGSQLASNDNSGYNNNALINYNFSANTQYKIRVKFYSTTVYGGIKIGISPTYSTTLSLYAGISLPMTGTYTALTTSSQNSAHMFRFKPTSTAKHTVATTGTTVAMQFYVTKAGSVELCLPSKPLQEFVTQKSTANDESLIIIAPNPISSPSTRIGIKTYLA